MPVPAMRRMTPAGVTSRTTLSPLSAMNTSPLASTAVPPGWYSDALVAWPPSPCSPKAVSDPANAVVVAARERRHQVGAGVGDVDGAVGGGHADRVVQAAARAGRGVGQGL